MEFGPVVARRAWRIVYALFLLPALAFADDDLADLMARADRGDAYAQVDLATRYLAGDGVPKDYKEAVRWLRNAAEQGGSDAQHKLGSLYRDGIGVQKDQAEATRWFRMAAEQGSASAQYDLGTMFDVAARTHEEYSEAAFWYRRAADSGHPMAQYSLGVFYANGLGLSEDDSEALKLYRKSAEQGYVRAQLSLGIALAKGEGIGEDARESSEWMRKAAEQGDATAQFNLGLMYGDGFGVPQNDSEAYFWLNLAGVSMASAREERERIRARLTPSEVATIQARAVAWQPKAAVDSLNSRSLPSGARNRTAPSAQQSSAAAPRTSAGEPSELAIDTAKLTAGANLRASPGGETVAVLPKGTLLALVDRAPQGEWYSVIDIESGREGWVNESVVTIHLAPETESAPIFSAIALGTNSPPEVTVTNKADRKIWLRVGEQRFEIDRMASLSVSVPEGVQSYIAWTAGVIPAIGSQAFERGYAYEWEFWIETRYGTGRRRRR
jgi:TPR repeat protein